ncbi:MAG: [protein-PII] uridylyltransferase, partial [Marivivens sp.]|nr:[protein-PII] uridylyltransferase [Marivivens sp.]NDH03065.1 [protein-PII] uridylyltransferase [Marivivens sp.]
MRDSASEPTLLTQTPDETSAIGLICAAVDIFDELAVQAEIDEKLADLTDAMAIRKAVVDVLIAARKKGVAAIEAAFVERPFDARPVTRSYTMLTDYLVKTVYDVARTRLHKLNSPTDGERLAIVAVGGYGRGEMAPHSDVDLLFVTPYKITPWAESLIESMLYMLWDLRLKVGHASRTIKDCLRLAREDYTIRTSLVEFRFLDGDADLAKSLNDKLWSELFSTTATDFVEAKLEERAERHRKQGGQRYVVEPNVKEGKGGLRDLQSLFWIAKYV